jgi:glycosyltransferase involved in cell wall biosynthesis
MVKLSWIIPAYNESLIIGITLERLQKEYEGLDIEIVVADDGSIDNTKQIASEFFSKRKCGGVVGIHHTGKGSALINGILFSTGDIIILSAADLILERKFLEEILYKMMQYDMIMLSKSLPQSIVRRPLSRKLLSFVFNMFIRILFGLSFKDTQGLKIIRRECLLDILNYCHDTGFIIDLELVVFAQKLGYTILESPWIFDDHHRNRTMTKDIPRIFFSTIKLRMKTAKTVFTKRQKYYLHEKNKIRNS